MQILLLAQHVSGTTMELRVMCPVCRMLRSAIKTFVAPSLHFISTDFSKKYVRRQYNSSRVFTLPGRILGHKGTYYVFEVLLVVG